MKHLAPALALAVAASGSSAFAASQSNLQPLPTASKTYSVKNITANNAADAAAGEAQLSVTVADFGMGLACFTFNNVGPEMMSITSIYFENDGMQLTGLASINDSDSGVAYKQITNQNQLKLPGGNQPSVDFDAAFGVKPKSQGGFSQNGVGLNESLTVCFNLDGSFDQLITALDNGDRIGFHVQAFCGEGSESFVTVPPSAVPTPSAVGLGMGLLGLAAARRRREQTPDA